MRFLRKMISWGGMWALLSASTALAASNSNLVNDYEQVQIFLSEESIVEKSDYTLAEIANVEGADPVFLEKLANVVMGRSPLPGGSIVINRSLIITKLRPYIHSEKLAFGGTNKTTVRRSALRVSGDDIDQAVLNHVASEMEGNDFKTKLVSQSRDVFLPRGTLSFEVKLRGKYKKEGGYRNYVVEFKIDQKLIKKVPIRVYVKIYKDVYVAKDTIKRDHLIQDADLTKIRKNVDRLPTNYVLDKSTLVGKIAKRSINPNEVLHKNTVTTAPIINSGDQVMIVYETPNLRLTAPGIAMHKGRLGERISVRNTVSKALLQAIVKNKNFVQVN
ncbi:MAG: flagellar basal body P-ring formation protein FlgA [SAR324 cluster bacterium]|nr:flagellar basal body P-ring formation protein FlgA [SAR324 cluster bacterium]